jgi:hypothetical protein
MSNRNATFAKRQREQNQKEKAQAKAARRVERQGATKEPRAPGEDDIDPDLIGIVPGPQPRAEDDAPPEDLSVSLVPSPDQDSP